MTTCDVVGGYQRFGEACFLPGYRPAFTDMLEVVLVGAKQWFIVEMVMVTQKKPEINSNTGEISG
jgi:hypothetical protein